MTGTEQIVRLMVEWRLRQWPSRPAVRLPGWVKADLRGECRHVEITRMLPRRIEATAIVALDTGRVEAMLVTLVRRQSGWWIIQLTLLSEHARRTTAQEDAA